MVTTPPASKAIILTGGTRGLGWEMAEALIDAGHSVRFLCRRVANSDLTRALPAGTSTASSERSRPRRSLTACGISTFPINSTFRRPHPRLGESPIRWPCSSS